MIIVSECYKIEYKFVLYTKTDEEREIEIKKLEDRGYELVGKHEINNGTTTYFDAKLSKHLEEISQ